MAQQNKINYLNYRNIKRKGIDQKFTSDQIKEYAKCMGDPFYFITNYVKIRHVDRADLITFEPFDFQESLMKSVIDNRFNICKYPRQCRKVHCYHRFDALVHSVQQ